MNEKDPINNIKKLQSIKPDAAYSEWSRSSILSSRKSFLNKEIELPRYGWFLGNFYLSRLATSFGIIVTIIAVGYIVFYYLPTQQKRLVAEANEINAEIKIKLNDIQYYLDNNREISQDDATTIINLLQQSAEELNKAKDVSSNKEDIETTLEQIKNAEKTLTKINELLQ